MPDLLDSAHQENYREELLARRRFLGSVPWLTHEQIAEFAHSSGKDAGQTANRWKTEGRVFSIPAGDAREVYPAFQFRDRRPRKIMAKLLAILSPARTQWEIAQWFIAPNGWLDGDRPIEFAYGASTRRHRDLEVGLAEGRVVWYLVDS